MADDDLRNDDLEYDYEAEDADDYGPPEDPEVPGGVLASRGLRLGGAVIDGLLAMFIMLPILYWLGVFDGMIDTWQTAMEQARENPGGPPPQPATPAFDLMLTLKLFAIGWGIWLVMHGYLLYKYGQTIGKRLVGTKIVNERGEVPAFGKLILMRYLLVGAISQVPGLGGLFGLINVLLIFRQNRHCLHDDFAGTNVVRVAR